MDLVKLRWIKGVTVEVLRTTDAVRSRNVVIEQPLNRNLAANHNPIVFSELKIVARGVRGGQHTSVVVAEAAKYGADSEALTNLH